MELKLLNKFRNLLERLAFESKTIFNELHGDCVAINSYAWVKYDGSIDHSNWGDDINWYFLREIIACHIISYDHARLTHLFHRPNYVVIGSTIDLRADKDSIIWGAGIIDSKTEKLPQFREIRAVRGPLTRKKLMDMGYDCPEVYGDPALLIPLHYRPEIKKTHKLGIIPHFHDLEAVRKAMGARVGVKLIDIRNYKHWHDFIDEILSCESIASSSLHGLIMAHAYGIPNVWVEFNNCEQRDSFKYHDFFASIGKDEEPLQLELSPDIHKIEKALEEWRPGYIDLKPLINSCPFKLRSITIDE